MSDLPWVKPPAPTMQFSAAHNMLVYENVDPAYLGAVEGKVLPDNRIAVPATLSNLQSLRKLGLPVINLMDREYVWPAKPGFSPFDHQRVIGGFLSLHPRCLNLSDIGTGKTLSTLWAADYLMKKGVIKRALVISTLSTLHETWSKTIFEHFLGTRRSVVLHGDRTKRLSGLNTNVDFYIVNHDGLGIGTVRGTKLQLGPLAAAIIERKDIDLVIVDEATAFKNSGTLRYRILRSVLAEKPYVWLLSGAPTPNAPTDAWALRRLIDPGLRTNFFDFRDSVMYKATAFKWVPKDDAAQRVARFLQPSIRFNREDCLDLPPLLVERREVALSDSQKKAFKEMKDGLSAQMESGAVINAVNEAALRLKLIQIACGAVYDSGKAVHKVDVAPRLAVLREIIEEASGKIIVFSSLTSIVNLLKSELEKHYDVAMVTGETNATSRQDIFRRFQGEANPRILVANPAAMAHGVTLTEANTICWFGPTDNPETYTQANGRVNRPGQTRNMLIVQICATQIEKDIYDRLEKKQSLQGVILNFVKEGMTNDIHA